MYAYNKNGKQQFVVPTFRAFDHTNKTKYFYCGAYKLQPALKQQCLKNLATIRKNFN